MISIESVLALLALLLTASIALAGWMAAIYRVLRELSNQITRICGEVEHAKGERKRLWRHLHELRGTVNALREKT